MAQPLSPSGQADQFQSLLQLPYNKLTITHEKRDHCEVSVPSASDMVEERYIATSKTLKKVFVRKSGRVVSSFSGSDEYLIMQGTITKPSNPSNPEPVIPDQPFLVLSDAQLFWIAAASMVAGAVMTWFARLLADAPAPKSSFALPSLGASMGLLGWWGWLPSQSENPTPPCPPQPVNPTPPCPPGPTPLPPQPAPPEPIFVFLFGVFAAKFLTVPEPFSSSFIDALLYRYLGWGLADCKVGVTNALDIRHDCPIGAYDYVTSTAAGDEVIAAVVEVLPPYDSAGAVTYALFQFSAKEKLFRQFHSKDDALTFLRANFTETLLLTGVAAQETSFSELVDAWNAVPPRYSAGRYNSRHVAVGLQCALTGSAAPSPEVPSRLVTKTEVAVGFVGTVSVAAAAGYTLRRFVFRR